MQCSTLTRAKFHRKHKFVVKVNIAFTANANGRKYHVIMIPVPVIFHVCLFSAQGRLFPRSLTTEHGRLFPAQFFSPRPFYVSCKITHENVNLRANLTKK